MFAVQQASVALDALEWIVRGVLLVETEIVLVGLFVLQLLDISPNNDTDIEMEEKANNVTDDKSNLSTSVEDRATGNFVVVAIVALNQRALGEDEVERESRQRERGKEAYPNENRIGLDHATVSDNRANEPEKRDDSDDSENDTGDNETNPSSGRDFNLTVVQEIWSCIDSMNEPEKCTSTKSTTDEGQQGGDKNSGPDRDTATEVSASTHSVLVKKS